MKKGQLYFLLIVLGSLFYAAISLQGKDLKEDRRALSAEYDTIANIDSCFAIFDYSQTNNIVEFINKSTTTDDSIVSFLWDFGNSNQSDEKNPVYTYKEAGTYSVSLSMLTMDSCSSYTSKKILIEKLSDDADLLGSCNASFSYFVSEKAVSFTNKSTIVNDSIIFYSWNFGDEQKSTIQNPVHTYTNTGIYSVSLTILTKDSCASFASEDISVGILSFTGKVYAGSSLLPSGKVYLYSLDTIEQQYSLLDSGDISKGVFDITSYEQADVFAFYAVPKLNLPENHYPEYFPTYRSSEFYWKNTNMLYYYTGDTMRIDLSSRSGIFYGGGYISGILDSGQFKDADLDGATALLLDKNQKPLKYVQLNDNHTFNMGHVPYGEYYLLFDKMGIPDVLHPVSVTSSDPSIYVEVIMNETGSSSSSSSFMSSVYAYPNPCSGNLTIQLDNESNKKIPIQVVNVAGHVVFSGILTLSGGKIQLGMDGFPNGLYTVTALYHTFKVQKINK